MDSVDDFNKSLFINGVKYLQELSDNIPNEFNILKSFYTTKCRVLEERTNIYLKSDKNRQNQRCSRCCLELTGGPASYRVRHGKKSKFANKLIRRKLQKQNESWTNYQTRYLKRLDISKANSLVATCKFCTKDNVTSLPKPVVKKTEKIVQKIKKPKKKKKKDKSCGLNLNGVQPVKPQLPSTIKQKPTILKDRVIKKKPGKKAEMNRLKKITAMLTNSKTEKPVNKLSRFLQSLQ